MKSAKQILLFIVLYIIPLSGVGTDLYSPSLPAIAKGLMVPATLAKLTLSAYLFGFSPGQFIMGTLSDIHGRRIILVLSLGLFTLASFSATMIDNIYFLLFVRLVQGFAAAGPSVIAKAILTDTLTGNELKKASIYLVMIWGLSPIIAPGIGGYLQQYFGWHANFYFFAAYSLSMFLLVVLLLKETNLNLAEPKWKKIFKNYGKIISNGTFITNAFCMALCFSIIMVFNLFTPFLVQNILGYSAVTYGHMAMIIGVAFFIGTFTNRWLMLNFHTRYVNRFGMILLILIVIIMMISIYFTSMTLATLVIPVFFIIFVMGTMQTNFMSHCLSIFPHMGGSASAFLGGTGFLVAGLITSISSLLPHPTTQIPVSWIYTAIIGLYVLMYWIVLDSKQPH